MEQDPDNKKKTIRCFKEVELRESEFKKAGELDPDEIKNIRDEYLKRTVIYPLIWIVITAPVFVFGLACVLPKFYESSVAVLAVFFPIMLCGTLSISLAVRCISSLTILSKIKKQDFWWHAGTITRKKLLWIPLSRKYYYIVDDEYCSQRYFDPFYRKGTEVYFLYFPNFMKSSYMGGIVVRRKD